MSAAEAHEPATYGTSGERPPWIEEAADPTFWDVAFGSYGDGYLEWVTSRYFWDVGDERTVDDTRTLWTRRAAYADPDAIVAHHVNERIARAPSA